MPLSGKTAIISGAASGVGKCSAKLFAREGAKVMLVDIQAEKGEEVAEQIRADGGDAIFQKTDITNTKEVQRMVEKAVENWGKIDILFNNAGIGVPNMPIEELDEQLFDKVMNVNFKSVFLMTKYVVPEMKKNKGGCIINTASIAARRPRFGHNAYASSKGAIISFTKAMAVELAAYNIRVNCINPVAIDTPMMSDFLPNLDREEAIARLSATIPLGRLCKPEDIAYGALFLASDQSSMITGIELDIDGGRAL